MGHNELITPKEIEQYQSRLKAAKQLKDWLLSINYTQSRWQKYHGRDHVEGVTALSNIVENIPLSDVAKRVFTELEQGRMFFGTIEMQSNTPFVAFRMIQEEREERQWVGGSIVIPTNIKSSGITGNYVAEFNSLNAVCEGYKAINFIANDSRIGLLTPSDVPQICEDIEGTGVVTHTRFPDLS